jgi:hypothetical protein
LHLDALAVSEGADVELERRAARADADSLTRLAGTVPTTRAGAVALLAFVREQYEGGDDATGPIGDSYDRWRSSSWRRWNSS